MTMGTFCFYKCNSDKIQARRNSFPLIIFLLVSVFLWTGSLTSFDEGRDVRSGQRQLSVFVEAFSTSSLSASRSSFSLLAERTEDMVVDDHSSFANDTVNYSDVINIVTNAQYMDAETKNRFIESLKTKISDVSNDVGETRIIDPMDSNGEIGSDAKITLENTRLNTKGCQIPTIEGVWEDDGGPFHATGAWQTTPLLMKGAFANDIEDLKAGGSYPFPSWEEIIELACDEGSDNDHNIHDEIPYEEDFLEYQANESEDDDDEDNNDEFENQYGMWPGNDDGFEDGDDGFYLWEAGSNFDEDEEGGDNPPSRLIQHSWPSLGDSNYYHRDVNTNWLDTFEIKQFGPFSDPESLEALLRTEDNDNEESDIARTLLVNDVDRWFPKLSDWMDRRFNSNKNGKGGVLPARWRRDDAQISLSYPKGGIGPHVDDYDVFLIQLEGERTWDVLWEESSSGKEEPSSVVTRNYVSKLSVRDETDCMLPESSMNGVRILNITKLQSLQEQRCGTTRTRLTRLHLRPGDCLYLPPRVLHCGTAIEASANCMTLSVGCRAPSALELLDGLSDLMKKTATTGTPEALSSPGSMFPSGEALQAFHKRYTNTQMSPDERNGANSTRRSSHDNDTWDTSFSPTESSWLSPQVKDEIKTLVLKAVENALNDDTNILDPLVGRFVTKSNRLDEDQFDLGDGDVSSIPSYSYPKKLRKFDNDDGNESEDNGICAWDNATSVLMHIFDKPQNEEETEFVLRRSEGISFAWSSVYDTDLQVQRYRLYAQGRPPFEVIDEFSDTGEDEKSKSIEKVVWAPNSVIGRMMDRIANGEPLNRAFLVDELQILVDLRQIGAEYTISRLLHDLIEEGLLYAGPRIL